MKTSHLIFLVVIFLSVGNGCGSPQDDLKMICDETTQFSQEVASGEGEYGKLDPMVRQRTLAKNIESGLKSSDISDAWEVLEVTAPEDRYELLQRAAEASGNPDWECPAVKKLWSSPGKPE